MPLTHIPAQIALSKITGLVVAGGTGLIYAFNDTGFVTPLQARNGAGDPIPTPNSNAQGRIPEFWVDISDQDPGIYWVANGTDPTFVYSVNGFRGKSAFQHAVAAGYAGTETEFNEGLADAPANAQLAQEAAADAAAAAGLVGAPAGAAVTAAIDTGGAARATLDAIIRHRTDTAGATTTLVELDHYATAGFAYGLDIQNYPGANSALVLHQYSSAGNAAFTLDNTGSAPGIRIDNTENQTLNPGSVGTGVFFRLSPWNGGLSARFDLRDDLMWENASPYGHGVINQIGGAGFTVDQQAAGLGVVITSSATGLWGMTLTAPTNGAKIALSDGALTTSHQGLLVTVSTGASQGIRIENSGTGWSLYVRDATTPVAGITALGEFEKITAGGGIILKSPGGTRYRLSVANGGTLVIAAA